MSLPDRQQSRLEKTRLLAVPVLGVAMMFLVSGCSTGSSSTAVASSRHSSSRSTGAATSTSVTVPVYQASRNARPDVGADACTQSSQGWQLTGVVDNPTSAPRRYSIAVDFVRAQGDTVVATTVVNVPKVDGGHVAHWATPREAAGETDLSCVIRQALWTS
ncbi:MAG TPA: hypothetical protein VEJ87_09000 [Acidimicrobiales bacterium]|nr:hypothetical protein [Acidimicrobiales bacterium]